MRASLVGLVCSLVALAIVAPATAQAPAPSAMSNFRVEEDTGAPTRGAVAGWVYNDGRQTVGLIRMRMDVYDESGQVVAVQHGWAYGNVRPGDRAYFRIALPDKPGARRVVSVESFVIQSVEAP